MQRAGCVREIGLRTSSFSVKTGAIDPGKGRQEEINVQLTHGLSLRILAYATTTRLGPIHQRSSLAKAKQSPSHFRWPEIIQVDCLRSSHSSHTVLILQKE
jgi:hypothetical protein